MEEGRKDERKRKEYVCGRRCTQPDVRLLTKEKLYKYGRAKQVNTIESASWAPHPYIYIFGEVL